MLNVNKTCAKNTNAGIYEIKYTMVQSINNQNIDRGVPLCLNFSDVDAHNIEENENKYLVFALTGNKKKVLEQYKNFWSKTKKQIKTINRGECNSTESIKYKNAFMKIRFDLNDDLPLNKILCFSDLDIIVESVFRLKMNIIYKFMFEYECYEHE